MSDIVERKQWFESNKHLFSEGMQQRWLTCTYQDECLIAEIERMDAEIERLNEAISEAVNQLSDPCDACDFSSKEEALIATIKAGLRVLTASEAKLPAAGLPKP